jgi:D-glycero-D-manno-heptose 1,7-bisphosphate phosphatase
MRPAVFLDRDGTLTENTAYLSSADRVALFPWTIDALRLLSRAGFALVVVTNQSGVARGFFDEERVTDVHRRIDEELDKGGVRVDGYYYCPHLRDAAIERYRMACDCRKPRPGLVQQAARELSLDVSRSYVVGDQRSDIELADAVSTPGILVAGRGDTAPGAWPQPPAAVVANLAEAASWILMAARRR